jgi:hydroxymethylpyrimidine/phosphomethylpyrimidine kinase
MFAEKISSGLAPPAPSHYRYPRVLSIAGSDSAGAAGIQADLKTFAALGCYGMTAITAVTAQNTLGVTAIHAVPPDILRAQIDAVMSDIGVDAIKIGMLPSPEAVRVVAEILVHYRPHHVVLDPVMVTTSGTRLMAAETVQVMVELLLPQVSVLTPNLDEAAVLLGHAVHGIEGIEGMEAAAHGVRAQGASAVLLKGGHLQGDTVVDLLAAADGTSLRWTAPRIASPNLRGTGCTLSSALTAYLALGHNLPHAVALARAYLMQAITSGCNVTTGNGHGPLNHGHAPVAMHKLRKH